MDTLEIIKSIVFVALPRFSLFTHFYQNNDIARYIIGATGYFFTFSSILDSFSLALSKYISITFPYFFRDKLSQWSIQLNFVITIILPIIIFSYQFGTKDYLVYDTNTGGYVFSSETSQISKINNTIAPIFSSTILILQITLISINIYKLRFKKNSISSSIKYKYLSKIVLYCAVSTIGITITTLRFWIKHYGAFYDSSIRNLGQTFGVFSSVISSTSEPYLLLIINKKLRYEYFTFYGKKDNRIHSTT